jgi:hypothetical protein
LQVSSAYDFEHFAEKIEKLTSIAVNEIEGETANYLLQRENETKESIALWLKHVQDSWDQEKDSQKKVNRHSVEAQMNAEWSAFIKERRLTLSTALKTRLEEIFPSLVECFISTIIQKYESGTFTMPQRFITFVSKEGFILMPSQKEKIVFTSGNLFIEYSVERILEELEYELTSHFQMKDDTWQA